MSFYEKKLKIILWVVIGLFITVILTVFSSTLGAADITFNHSLQILLKQIPYVGEHIDISALPKMHPKIVLNLRLPRIFLSMMVGGLLASSGSVYQSVFRNPMADPFVLGISSGAALGAALAMILGINLSFFGISSIGISAFLGSVITTLAVYYIASIGKKTPVLTLVLTGIAISFLLGAVLSLLITFNRDQMEQIIFWMYGSFATASWSEVKVVLPIYIIVIPILILKSRTLNIMTLGEESAYSLGVDVKNERMILLLTASLATAAAVSVTGIIGFVGLIIPHVLRLISGPDNRSLIPYSLLVGGIFLIICDAIARIAAAPMELPIGVITALVGAPYFIYLIFNNKKRGVI